MQLLFLKFHWFDFHLSLFFLGFLVYTIPSAHRYVEGIKHNADQNSKLIEWFKMVLFESKDKCFPGNVVFFRLFYPEWGIDGYWGPCRRSFLNCKLSSSFEGFVLDALSNEKKRPYQLAHYWNQYCFVVKSVVSVAKVHFLFGYSFCCSPHAYGEV